MIGVLTLTQLRWAAPRPPAAHWRPSGRPPAVLALGPMASLFLPEVGARLPWTAEMEESFGSPTSALRPQLNKSGLEEALAPAARAGLEEDGIPEETVEQLLDTFPRLLAPGPRYSAPDAFTREQWRDYYRSMFASEPLTMYGVTPGDVTVLLQYLAEAERDLQRIFPSFPTFEAIEFVNEPENVGAAWVLRDLNVPQRTLVINLGHPVLHQDFSEMRPMVFKYFLRHEIGELIQGEYELLRTKYNREAIESYFLEFAGLVYKGFPEHPYLAAPLLPIEHLADPSIRWIVVDWGGLKIYDLVAETIALRLGTEDPEVLRGYKRVRGWDAAEIEERIDSRYAGLRHPAVVYDLGRLAVNQAMAQYGEDRERSRQFQGLADRVLRILEESPRQRFWRKAYLTVVEDYEAIAHGLQFRTDARLTGLEEPTAPIGPAAGYMATSLFQYPAQLQWLVEQFQSNGVPRVIVSAGSSSGEEPASIAYTVRTELEERFSVYAIEPHEERLADMRHHFVDGAPFAMAPGIAHPPEALARVSGLNQTIAQWSPQIQVVDTPMEFAPPALYQDAGAVFLNYVADVPSVDTDAVATILLQLPPNAVLYTTRKDERLLDLAGPGSGFSEWKQDPNSEAVAWRRMSRDEELADLSDVLHYKDAVLHKDLRDGTVVTLDHRDARWIPRDHQLLLVPRVSEAPAPTVTLWVDAALRESVVGRVPPAVTVKSFEPEADLPTAIRALSAFPEEGVVQLVAVSAGQRDAVASMTGSHVPILVLDPGALPEELSSLLVDLAARASQLDGRFIDVTRGPVEHVTLSGQDVVLLYAV